MTNRSFRTGQRCLVTFVSLALACTPVLAGPAPASENDILYQDLGWGGDELNARGYTMITSDFHNGKTYEYWWKSATRTCLKAAHGGHRYESLETTTAMDCNQKETSSSGMSTGAKVAIGAAALLGVAALAARSHQREDKHNQNEQNVAEHDRGYRDGLHHESFNNYNNSQAYVDGYNTGQQQRSEETNHRHHHNQRQGYVTPVSLDDLVGARAASADSELTNRGFRSTGGYNEGNRAIATWYNAGTHQCMQVVTRDGHIKRIESIFEGNCR